LTPPTEEGKTSGSSLEHIIESEEEMSEEEDHHVTDDKVYDTVVDALMQPKVIDLMETSIELKSATRTQARDSIISPGEHMVVYRNKALLAKLLQQLL
jgi:hypothetical protein